MPQLVGLLSGKESGVETAAILHSLLGRLASHEQQAFAITFQAEKAVIDVLENSNVAPEVAPEVVELGCGVLASLCETTSGRAAVDAAGGIVTLIKVRLKTIPNTRQLA